MIVIKFWSNFGKRGSHLFSWLTPWALSDCRPNKKKKLNTLNYVSKIIIDLHLFNLILFIWKSFRFFFFLFFFPFFKIAFMIPIQALILNYSFGAWSNNNFGLQGSSSYLHTKQVVYSAVCSMNILKFSTERLIKVISKYHIGLE